MQLRSIKQHIKEYEISAFTKNGIWYYMLSAVIWTERWEPKPSPRISIGKSKSYEYIVKRNKKILLDGLREFTRG